MKTQQPTQSTKLTFEQFALKAIQTLRMDPATGKLKVNSKTGKPIIGINTVITGFNKAFKQYFGEDSNPVAAVTKLQEEGKIQGHFVRGGYMIYLPGEMPARVDTSGEKALALMGV